MAFCVASSTSGGGRCHVGRRCPLQSLSMNLHTGWRVCFLKPKKHNFGCYSTRKQRMQRAIAHSLSRAVGNTLELLFRREDLVHLIPMMCPRSFILLRRTFLKQVLLFHHVPDILLPFVEK